MAASAEFREVTVLAASGAAILDRVSLAIAPGEAVAFVGRSGAGKTTALKLINGLVRPTSGEVLVDGAPLPAAIEGIRRRMGYVIQGVGLFPHRTVFDNVATVPRLLGWRPAEIEMAVHEMLEMVELPPENYASRFPRSLSGGEQQRVGIARALVFRPSMLLCDEPFGALDPIVRSDLQRTVVSLRRDRGVTVVFVTHDVAEALRVSERVVHFEGGRVLAAMSVDAYPVAADPAIRRFVASSSYVAQ